MDQITNAPTPVENKNILALEELNAKNKLFLLHMLEGKTPVEAHALAGYKSDDPHAAYMLKARLKDEYELLVQEASGVTKADIMKKLGWVSSLPVCDKFGPVTGISMANYLKALNTQVKLLETTQETKPKLTMIQINRFKQGANGAQTLDSVEETKIVEVDSAPSTPKQ
ncbi:MAG: hypothetical protein AB7V39_00590 [Nitrospiraceae bacterium]